MTKRLGIDINERPEGLFHLVSLTLPIPKLLVIPREVRKLVRKASRRRLLAVREMIDYAIEQIEPETKPSSKKQHQVEIE
jgi:hypothetical protein